MNFNYLINEMIFILCVVVFVMAGCMMEISGWLVVHGWPVSLKFFLSFKQNLFHNIMNCERLCFDSF
ncbi:hypothetical protein [Blochmannia endosymbiont of Camponotus (Colobopsis) obliquus]|uniref:hypothetical protein n=1 Tax=Blochmannia endosymbiont of Camponotus (Colobopsis) obliquus TaxID=1505597 RepID=UPI0011865AFE|nr:hypothetical protein [Blochmannia endosymbiont of Camponotus (Colobopsis) obliquus]